MPDKSYQNTLDWLFKQFPSYQLIGSAAYKPTLNNIQLICNQLGNPENSLRFIHIAGTNGKGSTSSMLSSILTESGEKVGLFTSPHILDFRERIRINGVMIPEAEVVSFCHKIQGFDLSFDPSFFEITFAMALVHFHHNQCSVCVIETGLGGRLDATNVITPILSVITNIGLEHTQFLGNTLSLIAREKGGIIKPTIPVVIGEVNPETKEVFKEIAKQNNSEIIFAEESTHLFSVNEFKLPLLGEYQKTNFRTVLTALNVLKNNFSQNHHQTIQNGLNQLKLNTGFFGRMQIMQREPIVIFDVSHNEDGIRATLNSISKETTGKLHLLYGSSSDKDVDSIINLFPKNAPIYFTEFANQRSMSIEQFEEIKHKKGLDAQVYSDPKKALESILSSCKKEDTVLVFGSFFLLTDLF